MASAAAVRRRVSEVSRRLLALLEEQVAPANAVQILVKEGVLLAPPRADAALPVSGAIGSILHAELQAKSAARVADYVRACESQGRSAAALRLLGRLRIRRAGGRTSLFAIGVEFVLLLFVLLIHAIFVLPQFKAVFDAAHTPLPMTTRVVFALIGPSGPFLYAAFLFVLAVGIWRWFPVQLGPLMRPIDRLLLALPLVGPALRQANGDRLSGWLGFAGADRDSQRAALEAVRDWYRGDLLSRECEVVLSTADAAGDVTARLAQSRGFDPEFRAVVALPDRAEALAALRARWRNADTLPESPDPIAPVLVQLALGIVVAVVVIAMYLPIFKIAALS